MDDGDTTCCFCFCVREIAHQNGDGMVETETAEDEGLFKFNCCDADCAVFNGYPFQPLHRFGDLPLLRNLHSHLQTCQRENLRRYAQTAVNVIDSFPV